MTAKEYALVEFLAREAGRVVGRAEISEHVWDEEFDPFSNLIEVYINRIRRKIDVGFAKPLLHTRRGAGYILSLSGETPSRNKPPCGAATMFSSVRIRLTLWYTLSMTIVLVALAAGIYFVLGQNVIRRADANAIELADSFLSTVKAELSDATNPAGVSDGIAAAISEHRFRDVSFVVYDANVICWALLKAIASPKNSRVRVAKCSPHPCARLPLLPKHSVRST